MASFSGAKSVKYQVQYIVIRVVPDLLWKGTFAHKQQCSRGSLKKIFKSKRNKLQNYCSTQVILSVVLRLFEKGSEHQRNEDMVSFDVANQDSKNCSIIALRKCFNVV